MRKHAALTPGTRFHIQLQLRTEAREACVRRANSDVLRRAELRKVQPTRGPLLVGPFVFYYDVSGVDGKAWSALLERGSTCFEPYGSHTVWLSHRGILAATSPEHLSRADDEEVRWMITSRQTDLIDARHQHRRPWHRHLWRRQRSRMFERQRRRPWRRRLWRRQRTRRRND